MPAILYVPQRCYVFLSAAKFCFVLFLVLLHVVQYYPLSSATTWSLVLIFACCLVLLFFKLHSAYLLYLVQRWYKFLSVSTVYVAQCCYLDALGQYTYVVEWCLSKCCNVVLVSPSAAMSMWRYWFRLSRHVYDGNRSFAPILRQSRWSLLYDVYWLAWWCWTVTGTWTGSKYYLLQSWSCRRVWCRGDEVDDE